MPELPDVTVYIESLERRVKGQLLEKIRLASPFVLRSVDPPLKEIEGRRVSGLRRMGKRIVFELEGGFFIVIHLMVSGRFQWKDKGQKIPGRLGLAAFDFSTGTLLFTEASTKKRASLHFVRDEAGLEQFQRGGLEVMSSTHDQFKAALVSESHTLKRSLTDPRLFSGIGNAYSDEILHRAQLSPAKLTRQLTDDEITKLHLATLSTLEEWTAILRKDAQEKFPEKVTAFREEMAVHGKYGKPCPRCGTKVQRIVYAENETNYCPRCQTGGKLLSDRSLARLLKQDWPKTIGELEEKMPNRGALLEKK